MLEPAPTPRDQVRLLGVLVATLRAEVEERPHDVDTDSRNTRIRVLAKMIETAAEELVAGGGSAHSCARRHRPRGIGHGRAGPGCTAPPADPSG